MARAPAKRKSKSKAAAPFVELGHTGLKRRAGTIDEEFLTELKGRKAIQAYREMRDNDAIIGAVLFAIDMLLRGAEWRVEAGGESPTDQEAAEFLQSQTVDMEHTWSEFISEVLSMLVFGWSYFEMVFKRRIGPDERNGRRRSRFTDGKIGWRKFGLRSQDSLIRWIFDEDGDLEAMVQRLPNRSKLVDIPFDKSLLFRTTSFKDNPEGRSCLRNAYRSWFFKKRIETLEGIGAERDLAGLPVAKVPIEIMGANASAEDKAVFESWKDMVRNVRRDEQEGLVIPSNRDEHGNELFSFELLTTGGRRQFPTTEIIQRHSSHIASTVLADFIMLGQGRTGSFALSKDKSKIFKSALEAWLDLIAEVLNRRAVPLLFRLNGATLETLPQLTAGEVESVDLENFGEFVDRVVGVGAMMPGPALDEYLRDIADIPAETDEGRGELGGEMGDTDDGDGPPADDDEDDAE